MLWRQRFKGSNKTARHDRHVGFRDQHSKPVLERLHQTVTTASTFREDDEDRFLFVQFLAKIGERVRATVFSPHRQSVKHDCRKRACYFRLEKDIASGNGKRAFSVAGNECRSKSQCVEMAAMIRREYKRPMRRQLLAADDRESMSDCEVTSQSAKNTTGVQDSQEARSRVARCGSAHLESGRCRGQVGGSRDPSDLPAAKNLLRLADSKPDEIIDVVKHSRCNKDQTIEPIENAAMPRNEFRGVLETKVAFN